MLFIISSFAAPALSQVITGVPAAQDSLATTPHASVFVGNKNNFAEVYSLLILSGCTKPLYL